MDNNVMVNDINIELSWQEINSHECEESSLYNMCSWAEAN